MQTRRWFQPSRSSDHRIVEGVGQYVHWDRPDAVVAAVRDVVMAVRSGGPVGGESADAGQAAEMVDASAEDQRRPDLSPPADCDSC